MTNALPVIFSHGRVKDTTTRQSAQSAPSDTLAERAGPIVASSALLVLFKSLPLKLASPAHSESIRAPLVKALATSAQVASSQTFTTVKFVLVGSSANQSQPDAQIVQQTGGATQKLIIARNAPGVCLALVCRKPKMITAKNAHGD